MAVTFTTFYIYLRGIAKGLGQPGLKGYR